MFGGDLDAYRELLHENLRIFQEIRDDTWGLGKAVGGLGGLAALRGDPTEARRLILETWPLRETGKRADHLGSPPVPVDRGESTGPARAGRPAGRRGGGLAQHGERPDSRAFIPYEDPGMAAARRLSDEAFQRAWTRGPAMSLEEALAYAREDA
jgi:hypothetical protein